MLLAITLFSILALTALAFLVRKVAALWLCPLCAGVAGTWLWLLGAHLAGFELDLRIPAILLGGSVVGLATQGEKLLAGRSETYHLIWKTLFVTVGFATAWFIITLAWGGIAIGLVTLGVLTAVPKVGAPSQEQTGHPERIGWLKEQMKNCC